MGLSLTCSREDQFGVIGKDSLENNWRIVDS